MCICIVVISFHLVAPGSLDRIALITAAGFSSAGCLSLNSHRSFQIIALDRVVDGRVTSGGVTSWSLQCHVQSADHFISRNGRHFRAISHPNGRRRNGGEKRNLGVEKTFSSPFLSSPFSSPYFIPSLISCFCLSYSHPVSLSLFCAASRHREFLLNTNKP